MLKDKSFQSRNILSARQARMAYGLNVVHWTSGGAKDTLGIYGTREVKSA